MEKSIDKIDKIKKILESESLVKELSQKDSMNDIINFFMANGVELSQEDLKSLYDTLERAKQGENVLSDEVLSKVSGGANAKYIAIGIAAGVASMLGAAALTWAIDTSINRNKIPKIPQISSSAQSNYKPDPRPYMFFGVEKSYVDKNVKYIGPAPRQEGSNMCWVASTQSVLKQHGIEVSQAEIYRLARGQEWPSQESERTSDGDAEDMQNAVRGLNRPGVSFGVETCPLATNNSNEGMVPVDADYITGFITNILDQHGALSCNVGDHWVTVMRHDGKNGTFRVHDPIGPGGIYDINSAAFCNRIIPGILDANQRCGRDIRDALLDVVYMR